ncbi:uncharacterized protein LOC124114811 [Haliotis rufescens]|uniref:uncharacterized protein LOC124114811 n=1 Tax=Haliotis rufescens TaxID=6454 RepID=UPI00201F5D43|nr:uncharacterized protein LOC124114811 [Haliotis rufescens]
MEVAGSATSYDLLVGEDREYSITLRGGTQVGMSGESNPIVIPAYNKVPHPSDIVVEADSSTLYIAWGVPLGSQDPHQGRVTGYTLYYCNGSKITSKCEDTTHWHPFASDVRHYELKVQDGNLDNKMIGVSAEMETANRNVSSGLRWNTCVYRRNLVPPSPRGVVFSRHQPDNALSVEWTKFVCAETPIYVSYYVVSHCITNNHGGCAGLSVQVNVSTTKESQVIQGLSAGVRYRVTLRAVSRSGDGPESEPITRVVVNSDLTSRQIAGISLGGIFSCIVFVLFVNCCIRKLHKTYNSMTLEIKLPPLTEVDENEQHIIRETVTMETHNEKLRKGTQTSTIEKKPNNNENTLTRVEKVNPQTSLMSGHDMSEKPKTNLETAQIPQDDLKPLCKLVDTPCSGRECDQVKTSLQNKTDTSSSLADNCLKFALFGNSESTRQDAGSNYITRDKLSLLLGKTTPSPCDAPFDESSYSSGQDTASSPPPPYEPPRSPDDQKLETPPPTYSYYVSLSQADFPSAPKEMFPSCTNSHPLSTLLEHQSPSSSPSDVPNDQTQPHGESIGPQGLNIAPKLQSETDSPYIPLDKVPPPPPPEEQKTVSPPAGGYVSVPDASQHQSPSHFPSDVSFDQSQSDESGSWSSRTQHSPQTSM